MEKLPHELLIEEKQLTTDQLSKEVKGKLKTLNMQLKRKNLTENTLASVKKQSVVIADLILSDLESGLPNEKPKVKDVKPAPIEVPTVVKVETIIPPAEPVVLPVEPIIPPIDPVVPPIEIIKDPSQIMEEAVKAFGAKISISELAKVLGHRPKSSIVKIGSLTLRKGWLSSNYKIS